MSCKFLNSSMLYKHRTVNYIQLCINKHSASFKCKRGRRLLGTGWLQSRDLTMACLEAGRSQPGLLFAVKLVMEQVSAALFDPARPKVQGKKLAYSH